MRVLAFVLFLLSSATGCILGTGSNCSDIAVPGVSVVVKDAATGVRLCDATVQISDASGYKELLSASGTAATCAYSGAFERPGTYSVSVFEQGYAADLQQNVVVTSDACHVRTASLTSNLQH